MWKMLFYLKIFWQKNPIYCSQFSQITHLLRRPAVHTLVSFVQLLPETCKWAMVMAGCWSPTSGSCWGMLISGGALEGDISGEGKKTRWGQISNKITATLISFRWIKSVIPQTWSLSRFLVGPSPIWSQRASGCWQNQQSLGCIMFLAIREIFFMVTWRVWLQIHAPCPENMRQEHAHHQQSFPQLKNPRQENFSVFSY